MNLQSSCLVRFLLPTLLVTFRCFSQSTAPSPLCEPAPEVRKPLDQLPGYRRDPLLTDWQVYQQRLAAVKTLMRQYPNDVFVQRAYLESTTSMRKVDKASLEERAAAAAEYKSRHAQAPGNAEIDYLYGLTLITHDSPTAIQAFEKALESDPSFPYPHLSLMLIYNSLPFLNKEKAVTHLKAFLDACPAAFEGYDSLMIRIADKELLNKYGTQLRGILQARGDAAAVAAYQTLWSIEFKAYPPSEYEALRKQVGQDLVRLRQLNLQDDRQWYETLREGYQLANDPKQVEWAEQERERHFREDLLQRAKWFKDHPSPGEDAPTAVKQAYFTDLLAQTNIWLQKLDSRAVLDHFRISGERVRVMSELDNVAAADIVTAVEQRLKYAGENGGGSPWSTDPSPWSVDYSEAAETLSEKHIAPERAIEYAQKALAILEYEEKQPLSDLYAKEFATDRQFYNEGPRVELSKYEVKACLQLRDFDRAEALLAHMDRKLIDSKVLIGDDENRKRTLAGWRADYWGLMAQDAELRGRKTDAMSFYQSALLTRLDAQIKPAATDELTESAHHLWSRLNGTEEGWQLWYGRRANDLANSVALTWEKANQPLPPFELADLNNLTWNLAALKGKTAFISFWATWCGPCREELPHLQKLVESYKGRSDVQFITLNIDENPGLIRPFLDEQQLSLIVVPAFSYANEILQVGGIPQNWIMDGHGVVRLKSTGYNSSEKKWTTDMQQAIEQVRSSAAMASSSGVK